ncbi:MAG: hypothetical protein EOO02_12940, partial [Chitinophagaceae bacterium]
CKVAQISHQKVLLFFRNFLVPFTIFITVICIAIFALASKISILAVGAENPELVSAIRLFSIVPVIVCFNIPAYQSLLAYNFQNSAMIILVGGSILNLVLNLWLAQSFMMMGTVYSVLITELFIAIGLNQILRSRHPQIKLTLHKQN